MPQADSRATGGARPGWTRSTAPFAASVLAALIQMLPIGASAQSYEVKDFTIHNQYVSPRALGMGNAFTALADDYSALFYNPAGLARLEEGQINMGLAAGFDSKLPGFIGEIGEKSKSNDVSEMVQLLENNLGSHYSARVPALSAFWVRPKWGLAVIPVDLSMEFAIRQRGLYSLDLVATQDTTIAYGRGWDVKWFDKGRMSLGVTGKAIYRGYFNRSIPAADLIFDQNFFKAEDAAEGFTFDVDFGMLYTFDVGNGWWKNAKPSVGLVVRNVADYGFKTNFHLIDKNSKEPPRIGRAVDFGTAFELPDLWIWKTRVMADLRNIGHENFTISKGTHIGAEFLWKIRSWWQGGWRAGLNQGYFTAGFTGKLGIFNLDVVTFAQETGPSSSPKASRLYMAKASLDW